MKITASTNFLHGRMSFEKGRSYEVPDALGAYFKRSKWAVDAKADQLTFTVPDWMLSAEAAREGETLEIQNVRQTLGPGVH